MECITLFLCGDVMTGRGIDQILPHPGQPHLFEPYAHSARDYVKLAKAGGEAIPSQVEFGYIWGEALREMERMSPDARIINLETAVTSSEDAWPGKSIHYRMHPANVPILNAARIDCCSLANNHVLDWGYPGLTETLDTLHGAGIRTAGAGQDIIEAAAPACIDLAGGGRVLVFAFGTQSSGVGPDWGAHEGRPGVNLLRDLSTASARAIAAQVHAVKQAADVVIASIHWGANFDFDIPPQQRIFAHNLIEMGAVDVVHGHSSHHAKGIEVYRGKLILYGAGDFINDYEGIRVEEAHRETYRGDLALMYFPTVGIGSGRLVQLAMTPMRIRRFCVSRAPEEGVRWLVDTLDRESLGLGARVVRQPDNTLLLHWDEPAPV